MRWAAMALVLIAAASCRTQPTATPEKPAAQKSGEMKPNLSNPYDVAEWALDAYRSRDLEAYNQVLLAPAGSGAPFEHADLLRAEDEVRGLYFQDDQGREIAAVVRLSEGEAPAVYFWIVRTSHGFGVQELRVSDQNPKTEIGVEGY